MKKVHPLKLLIISWLTSLSVSGQQWEELSQDVLTQIPTAYSVDTESNLYIGFDNGRVSKYSNTGSPYPDFSLPNQSSITLIEAQNNRRIFLFYRDIQQITILDRFSSLPKNYPLNELDVYLADLACPAPDGSFWTIENNPQRIKKIDPLRNITLLEVQHILSDSLFFMRAYRNLLLIGDANGIQILDQFGSLLNSIPSGKTTYIQLFKDQLIAFSNSQLIVFDPYKSIILDTLDMPDNSSIGWILLPNQNAVAIAADQLQFLNRKMD